MYYRCDQSGLPRTHDEDSSVGRGDGNGGWPPNMNAAARCICRRKNRRTHDRKEGRRLFIFPEVPA